MAYYFADLNVNAPYITAMTGWIGRIREKVAPWIARWSNSSQSAVPQLRLDRKGDEDIVYDSRSGEVVEHRLSAFGRELLIFLEKPRHVGDVQKELGRQAGFDAEKEVAALTEKGLLFEEGGRLLSLALSRSAARQNGG